MGIRLLSFTSSSWSTAGCQYRHWSASLDQAVGGETPPSLEAFHDAQHFLEKHFQLGLLGEVAIKSLDGWWKVRRTSFGTWRNTFPLPNTHILPSDLQQVLFFAHKSIWFQKNTSLILINTWCTHAPPLDTFEDVYYIFFDKLFIAPSWSLCTASSIECTTVFIPVCHLASDPMVNFPQNQTT